MGVLIEPKAIVLPNAVCLKNLSYNKTSLNGERTFHLALIKQVSCQCPGQCPDTCSQRKETDASVSVPAAAPTPAPFRLGLSSSNASAFDALCEAKKIKGSKGCHSTILLDKKETIGICGLGDCSDDCKSCEMFYSTGQCAGAMIYQDDPVQLNIIAEGDHAPKLTVDKLTAFLHRLFYSMVKNEDMKSTGKDEIRSLKMVSITATGLPDHDLSAAFNTGRILAMNSLFNAGLVDSPPNYCNCITFAATITNEVKHRKNIEIKILDEKELAVLKMGAFLGVAQGSRSGARLVHMIYRNGDSSKKIALVGKGITIDTGGYNIKPTSNITWMKGDMAGAALVCSTLLTLADLEIQDVEVHAVACVCENMIDKDAYRPGDILTASNGKTIEVQNTDAEGRLALLDSLIYAEKALGGPGAGTIIDCATLTGAIIVGLGTDICAVYSNRDCLREQIVEASHLAGEATWPMPLRPQYFEKLKSPYCDYRNTLQGSAYGGSITAALFLQEFVDKKTPWAHMDMAGPAWNFSDNVATGWGIATLVNYIADRT